MSQPKVAGALLVLLALIALLARSLDFPTVFLDGGEVVLRGADGWYHARRALYTLERFPRVLGFDPYLNHPEGAAVPWPPLYDWLLGALALLAGGSREALDRVLAWASPVLGAATVPAVFFAGRAFEGVGVGLSAAALFAVLPMAVVYAGVGDPDHHAFLALLAACHLALSIVWVRRGPEGGSLVGVGAGLVAVRALLVLGWSGSPLYLAVGDGALLLAALWLGDARLARGQALGVACAAALVSPFVVLGGRPLGGWFSTLALSTFHVAMLLGIAWAAGAFAWLERRRPGRGLALRSLRLAAIVLAPLVLLALPPVREGLAPALGYLGREGSFAHNAEQIPLYAFGRVGPELRVYSASFLYGAYAYVLPALPAALLAFAWLRRDRRAPALVLMVWTLVLGGLAVSQIRWGNDFAPVAALGLALALHLAGRALVGLGAPRPLAAIVVASIGLALLAPAITGFYAHRIDAARDPRDPALVSPDVAFARFASRVAEATPATRGWLDPEEQPEYGILVPPGLGHALRFDARRPTPADNFGPQLDAERYEQVQRFYETDSEEEAVELARALRARFVVVDSQVSGASRVARRLKARAGSWSPHWEQLGHFRLVTEGPARGATPLGGGVASIPYRLFEVVPGATLEAHALPGTPLLATLRLRTPARGELRFRARSVADDGGVARVRVPYATEGTGDVEVLGPYQVELGDALFDVTVREAAVRDGATVRVAGAGAKGAEVRRPPADVSR